MFEPAHYALGLGTIKIALPYLFYTNICFLLFGSIGWFLQEITKARTPLLGRILVGYIAFAALAWALYNIGSPQVTFPALIFAAICVGWYAVAKYIDKSGQLLSLPPLIHALRKLIPLLLLELVLIIFWAGFLDDKKYHVLVSGNNDIYFWALMADHVMGISNIERINAGQGAPVFSSLLVDCFGVYAWFGLVGRIAMKSHTIEAAMLFQLTLIILVAWLVYEISVVVVGVSRVAAFVPSFAFSFNPLWVYVFTNNFLSQMTATFCFLVSLRVIGATESFVSNKKSYLLAGFVLYLSFAFSYPGLLLPYLAMVIASLIVFTYFSCKARQRDPLAETVPMMAYIIAGLAAGAVAFFPLTSHAIKHLMVLSAATAGWSLSMLDPVNLLGLASYSLSNTVFSNWPTYLFITVSLIAVFGFRRSRGRQETITSARFDSLLLLSIGALIAYLAVYSTKGDSYQQWKFATYFAFPLLTLVVVNYFAPKSDA